MSPHSTNGVAPSAHPHRMSMSQYLAHYKSPSTIESGDDVSMSTPSKSASPQNDKAPLPPFVDEMRKKDPKTFEQLTYYFFQQQVAARLAAEERAKADVRHRKSAEDAEASATPTTRARTMSDAGLGGAGDDGRSQRASSSAAPRSQSEEGDTSATSSSSSIRFPRGFPLHKDAIHPFGRPSYSLSPERETLQQRGHEHKRAHASEDTSERKSVGAMSPHMSLMRKLAEGAIPYPRKENFRKKGSCLQCHKVRFVFVLNSSWCFVRVITIIWTIQVSSFQDRHAKQE